ncbi:hypothetical protein SADO_07082 [Salinisphaera dokdonensis CL-ES53]|uniref:Right handed beta helix domain-containing protein n=1 Tax=Salinisphaera dokdonensis CL-ES53 TaxID=1304272 RepID=A0ABV2AZD0_9GAMM
MRRDRSWTPLRLTVQGVVAAVLCLCITAGSHAAQFHVAPDGANANAGTRDAPWATIAYALAQAEPGDTVYLHDGRYPERVRFPRSGSRRDGFITLRNAPGERPVIDGSDLRVEGGEQGLVTIADRSHVRVQGLHLTGFRSSDKSVPMGVFVTGAGSHIQLLDNRVTRIETHQPGCKGNALGIAVYGRRAPEPLSQVRIRGNEIAYLKTGCSESVSVNGNVTGFEISHNHIHDNNNIGIDVIGHEGMAPDPRFDIARNGVIASNTVHGITSSANSAYPDGEMAAGGIYVDGGRDVVIERNRVFDNDIGIELASEHGGKATRNVLVRNNLIYNNRSMGLAIGGYAPDVGGAEGCRIVHNTFYHNDTARSWGGEVVIQHNARDNLFKNNIVYANEQAVFINYYVESTPQPLISDHNLFYAERGRSAGQWQWRGQHFQGMAAYVRGTGNDRRSLFADPRFVAARAVQDFRLGHRSAAIDAGLNIGDSAFGDLDFEGRPRFNGGAVDVGAYEYD